MKNLGFKGIIITCFAFDIYANTKRLYKQVLLGEPGSSYMNFLTKLKMITYL